MCNPISNHFTQSASSCLIENKATLIAAVVGGILLALGPALYFMAGVGAITMSSLIAGGGAIILLTLALKYFCAKSSHENTTISGENNKPAETVNTSQNLSPKIDKKTQVSNAMREGDLEKVENLLTANPSLAENNIILDVRTLEMLQLFIKAKVDLEGFAFPLFVKIINEKENPDQKPILELLIEYIDVSAADEEGKTLLHYIAEKGMTEFIEPLYDRKTDINARTSKGEPPLHLAARFGHVETVEELISKGANINAVDNEGDTALHRAAYCDKKLMIQMLLRLKAKYNIINNNNKSPYDLALDNGNEEAENILYNMGASYYAPPKTRF